MLKHCYPSGGSRIFPRRGRQLPRGAPTYDFAKFSQKLHEIERIWAPRGGGEARVPRTPLRSATVSCPLVPTHVHSRLWAAPTSHLLKLSLPNIFTMKLREGNVFTGMCLSRGVRVGILGPRSLLVGVGMPGPRSLPEV